MKTLLAGLGVLGLAAWAGEDRKYYVMEMTWHHRGHRVIKIVEASDSRAEANTMMNSYYRADLRNPGRQTVRYGVTTTPESWTGG